MCRWIAYAGRPVALAEYLFEPEDSLVAQSLHARMGASQVNGDGFGVGWYGRRPEPGLFRDVRPAWGDENLRNLARHVDSPLFLAHVRAATGTETSRPNCHPFAHREMLFMHNGQVEDWPRLRRPLESLLPDELYAERRGTTDSEVLFLLLVHLGVARAPRAAVGELLETVERLGRRHGACEGVRLTCAFADGRSLHVVRYASESGPPSAYYRAREGGWVVVSEPLDARPEHWEEVPAGHMLSLGGGGDPQLTAL